MTTSSLPSGAVSLNVDDYDAGRYARSRTLQSAGFRVLEAGTGGDALRLVQETLPDLVLLDISLPDLDGREVCRRLREDPRTVALPVLQISSVYTGEQARISGLEAGGDAFLPGDVGGSELIATVRALLRMRQARESAQPGAVPSGELLETLREPIVQLDAEGRCAYLNPAAEELLGRARGTLLGRVAGEALPEFFTPIALQELGRVLHGGQTVRYEQWDRARDRWLAVRAAPATGGMIVRFDDITAQRREREALERFRFAAELARDLIFYADEQGRCVYANPAAARARGYTREELLRLSVPDVDFYYNAERYRQLMEQSRLDPVPPFESRLRRRNGSAIPVEVSLSRVTFAGRPHLCAITRDLTERLDAESALRISEEHLRLALEAGRIGTWEIDEWAEHAVIDPIECDLLGLPAGTQHVPVEQALSLVHPEDREWLRQVVQDARAAGGEYAVEFRMLLADGSVRWLATRARWQRNGDGAPARLYGVNFDVTERHRAAEALEEIVRQKDQFLSVLSHELRNPLSAIVGANHLLLQQPSLEQSARLAARIDRQARHLTRLVDDLLDVARIGQGKLELRRERVLLKTIVNGALEAVQPMIDERGHRVTVELPAEPVELDADPARLQQVIANLLSNAARYTEPRGQIQVSVETDADRREARLRVRDSGIGISAETLARIWEVFVQGDGVRPRSSGGLGIGLHLVRALVLQHGGHVEARSEGPGHGSEFVVRLPLPPAG